MRISQDIRRDFGGPNEQLITAGMSAKAEEFRQRGSQIYLTPTGDN